MKNGGDECDGTDGRTDASFRGSVGSQLTGVEIDLKRDSGRRGMLPLLIARFHDDVTLGVGGTRNRKFKFAREGGEAGRGAGGRGGEEEGRVLPINNYLETSPPEIKRVVRGIREERQRR